MGHVAEGGSPEVLGIPLGILIFVVALVWVLLVRGEA